jgi:flagellar motor switch protein FliN/FliY
MADRQSWLFEQFARKLAEVTESMVGSTVTATLTGAIDAQAPLPADLADEGLAWQQGFDAGPGCRMVVAASGSAWERIGGEALKAAGVDERDRDSVRGTYLEILSQALSGVASEIGGVLNRNISAVDGVEVPPAAGALTQAIQVVIQGQPMTLYAGIGEDLLKALAPPPVETATPVAPTPVPPAAGRPGSTERQEMLDGSKTLDLLLDVELPVSVSFGRASVPLKDVLKLTSGSIVELNRGVSDPVELIVNNCVIARGEVVVVEGNYGVRIQQIVSARERLRTLN